MGRKKEERLRAELEKRGAAFEKMYSGIWGDRWPRLKAALLRDKEPVEYSEGLLKPYLMDAASVACASLLPLERGFSVLDMCAAPGGKTLVLASHLEEGLITANDRSRDRKLRLDKVLDEHLPREKRGMVRTSNRDASTWGLREKEAYDAVLLDAPCSSERHVMASPAHMAMWSPSRPRRLATEQYALLCSGLMALRKGGFLLYSTCSVNPGENEGVVRKLMERRPGVASEIEINAECSERRALGRAILPDAAGGAGPMYFCLLRKEGEL